MWQSQFGGMLPSQVNQTTHSQNETNGFEHNNFTNNWQNMENYKKPIGRKLKATQLIVG